MIYLSYCRLIGKICNKMSDFERPKRRFLNRTKRFRKMDKEIFEMQGSDILIRALRFTRYIYMLILLHVCNKFIAYVNHEKVVDVSGHINMANDLGI